MVSVVRLDCQEHWALTMVSSTGPHHGTRLDKIHKMGPN